MVPFTAVIIGLRKEIIALSGLSGLVYGGLYSYLQCGKSVSVESSVAGRLSTFAQIYPLNHTLDV